MLAVVGVALGGVAQDYPCLRSKIAAEHPIRLRHVTILDGNRLPPEARPLIVSELRAVCDCWPCILTDSVNERIRDMYQWFGFFQAVAETEIVKQGVEGYDLVARVQEGPQYRLKDLRFTNVKAFPVGEVRRFFDIRPGDLFDTRKIRDGLEAMRRLYDSHGYFNFAPVPSTDVDSAGSAILLTIDAEEGPVFHLGELVIAGPEPAPGLRRKLLAAWQPHQGEVADKNFLDSFLQQNLSGVPGAAPMVEYLTDVKTGVLGVRLEFHAAAR